MQQNSVIQADLPSLINNQIKFYLVWEHTMAKFEEMGKAFVGFYYPAFSANRGAGSQLLNVYTDQSCLSFEGAQFQGKQAIMGTVGVFQ